MGMRGSPEQAKGAARRLAVMFAFLLVAFAIGSATHSSAAFEVVMALGLAVSLALFLKRAFDRS